MASFCLSAILLAFSLGFVASYDGHILAKSLRELTEQKRGAVHVAREQTVRETPLITCGSEEYFDLSLFIEEALVKFPVLQETLYKDIQFSKIEDISIAFENIVFDLVQNSQWHSFSKCIYFTWSMGYLTFSMEAALVKSQLLMASTASHALLHLDDPTECEEKLLETDSITRLFSETYAPALELTKHIDELVQRSGYKQSTSSFVQQMYLPILQMLSTPQDELTSLQVVETYMGGVCHQLEHGDLYQYKESSCSVLAHDLLHLFSVQLGNLKKSLEIHNIAAKAEQHFPTACQPMIKIFLDELLHDSTYVRLPFELLNATHHYLDNYESGTMDQMKVLRHLMSTLNVFDVGHGIQGESLMSHLLYSHVAVTSPVPVDTQLVNVHAEELQKICLEIFSQAVHMFGDGCIDYKLIAPLVGIVELKHLDLSLSNIHMVSIVEQIWRAIKEDHHYLDESVRSSLNHRFHYVVRGVFMTKLQNFISSLHLDYGHIGAFQKAETVVLDVVVLINEKTAKSATLDDLIEELASTLTMSFYNQPVEECPVNDLIYMQLKDYVMDLISDVEKISEEDLKDITKKLLADLFPLVSESTKDSVETVVRDGLASLASYMLEDIHSLASRLHGEKKLHSGMALANYIGGYLASSLYKVIRYYTTSHTTMPPPSHQVNENLQQVVAWQHKTINAFFSNYMQGLQEIVLNVALDSSTDLCTFSPAMCPVHHMDHQDSDHDHLDHGDVKKGDDTADVEVTVSKKERTQFEFELDNEERSGESEF